MKSWFTQNLGWKALSLAFAVLLWYSIIGEPEIATSLSVPIEYKNSPHDLEIGSDVAERVKMEVHGPSGKITPSSLAGAAIVLDLALVNRPGDRTFTINQETTNLPRGVTFYRAAPSQLRLRFERQASRDVPVTVRFAGPPAAGYRVARQDVEPKQLRVIGPENRVQQVESAVSDAIDLHDVVSEAEFHVATFSGDPRVRFVSSPMVTVRVRVEKIKQ